MVLSETARTNPPLIVTKRRLLAAVNGKSERRLPLGRRLRRQVPKGESALHSYQLTGVR
jgi:hypothetical protein